MALTHRPNTGTPATKNGASEIKLVGQIDGRSYEEHAKAPAVQAMVLRARKAWFKTHGYDPAASRLKSSS